MLKKIFIGLLAIVAIIAVIGLLLPKEVPYEGSIEIDATPEQVWQFTNTLENMDKWSPWTVKDPNIKQEFTGTAGEVGSENCWDSQHEEVGKGCQKITAVEANKKMSTSMAFERPFKSTGSASVELTPTENGTSVTWAMVGDFPFPMSLMTPFMDMEANMSEEWNAGLNKLKELTEAAVAAEAAANAEAEAAAEAANEEIDESGGAGNG
jgi:uncharacterized protein YndB with AHSA1/START domain